MRLIKTLSLFIGIILFLPSCNHKANFSGTLTGIESDTLLVFVNNMRTGKQLRTDTVALTQNHFELQLPDSNLYIYFTPKPSSPREPIRMITGKPVIFFPGNHIIMEGSIDDIKISGSELYDELAQFDEILQMEQRIKEINKEFTEAYKTKDKQLLNQIKKKAKEQYESILTAKMEAIKSNPNNMACAYYATELNAEKGLEAISLLSDQVKNGPMAILIQKAQKSYQKRIAREKAEENIKTGKQAPDLNLNTIDGKAVTLASFRGKYLLIDFWGTWCGWCIKGMPEMKKYYAKYNKKVEFLGIACNDTEKKWRETVANHQLPWVNAMEGNSDASVKYAVGGFPTKFLIDPEGKIVEVFVGETPDLYKKMDELFK